MDLDRELLNKFVDGELSPSETERVAMQLARQPQWNAYVEQQEAVRQTLRSGFVKLDHPLPERLVKTAREAPVSRQWLLRRGLRFDFSWRWLGGLGTALAAGLVIGFMVQPQKDLVLGPSGQLVARGDLGQILSRRLASENPAGAQMRVGLSFRNRKGQDCRTFTRGESAGLACRAEGNWVVETIVRHQPESPGAVYRMAGSEMPDAVRQAVAATIAGEPFDAAAETRARARGWSGR